MEESQTLGYRYVPGCLALGSGLLRSRRTNKPYCRFLALCGSVLHRCLDGLTSKPWANLHSDDGKEVSDASAEQVSNPGASHPKTFVRPRLMSKFKAPDGRKKGNFQHTRSMFAQTVRPRRRIVGVATPLAHFKDVEPTSDVRE